MDNRNNNTATEEQTIFPAGTQDAQSKKVTEILQQHGYENLEAFLTKNPYQRHLMQEEGDFAFYHPTKLAEKLSLFFTPAKQEAAQKSPVLFKSPSALANKK